MKQADLLALPLAIILAFNMMPALLAQDAPAQQSTSNPTTQSAPSPAATQPSTVVLDPATLAAMSSLVVNPNQHVAIDFGTLTNGINLSGNLTNSGSIYAYSTNPNVNVANIAANNILNNSGGLITSVLPQGGIPGLSLNLSSLVSNFSLNLSAINNIVNAGTISSAGNLSMSAGGSITNAGTMAGIAAMMSAINNVNLTASNIVNSGVIAAMQGNINIASKLSSDLILNNLSGQLSALNGAINLRDLSFAGKFNTLVSGGDFLSKQLNVFSGNGIANIYVRDISGLVNVNAGEVHITASTENLKLGSMIITGDPSIFNLAGDVTISGAQSFAGQPLSIVAAGNILSAAGAGAISTANGSGSGGNILMVAGANFTADTSNNLSILGASGSGGRINLAGTPITSLTSASTGGAGSGGNITLVAYNGTNSTPGAGAGTITLPTAVTITSGGNGAGANGNVLIIAGATEGTAITTGAINSSTGAVTTGNISVYTSTPAISGGGACAPCVTVNSVGLQTGGTFDATRDGLSNVISQDASLVVGNLTANGSTITLNAGRDASIGTAGAGSNAVVNNGSTGGGTTNIAVNSPRAFLINSATGPNNVNGLITANTTGSAGKGGTINLTNYGTGGITLTAPTNLSVTAGSTSGNGGTISLTAPVGTLTIPTGNLNANASAGATGGAGGTLTLNASAVSITGAGPLNMNAAANVNGKGGTISVTASGAASTITVNQTAAGALNIWAVGGGTSGDGGSVTLIAGGALNFTDSGASNNPQANGSGGSYYLQSGAAGNGVISYNGSFTDSNAVGTGSGGNITLITNSSTTFNLGSVAGGNGFSGVIHAHASTSGAGGKVTVANLGTGGITISNLGVIDVQQAGSGVGGEVSLQAPTGPITITPGSGTLFGTTTDGGGSGKGGTVSMVSTVLNLTNTYTINVNGGSSGSGGIVNITTQYNTGPIAIGTAAGQFAITATGGNGATVIGGTVNISSGQNLTVTNPATSLIVAPTNGSGGSITLTAGTAGPGNVSVSAALNANAVGTGHGGTISITSNSATTFNTSSNSGGNGVTGGMTANAAGTGNGGTISITNLSTGGISSSSLTSISATPATTGRGGQLTMLAPFGPISITAASGTLGGASGFNGVGTTGGGGLISLSAGSFSLTNNYTLTANSGTSATSGGTISITTTGQASPLTIGSGAGAFAISATGGNNSVTPTNVAITAAGNLTITSANLSTTQSSGRGPTIALTAGVTGSGFIAITGGLSANAVTSGNGGSITLTMNTPNTFNIGAGGGGTGTTAAITANAVGTGAGGTVAIYNLGTSGGITLNALSSVSVNSATSGNGGSLTLSAPFGTLTMPSGGSLSANASGADFTGGTIYLQGASLSFSTSGVLALNANAGTGTAIGGNVSVVTLRSTSDITIGSASGNITISARGGSAGGNGGTVLLSAGRNLTIDPSGTNFVVGPQAGTGNGANLTLRAATAGAGTVRFTGVTSFSANGLGSGTGGTINISSGNVIDVSALSSLSANGGTSGGGGQITLKTSSFNYPSAAALSINANGNGSGNGGIISIETSNVAIIIGSASGNIAVSAISGASGGNGGQVTISSGQGLTVNAASLSTGPQGTNGNGAIISLSAGTTDTNILTMSGSLTGLNGNGTGSAGQLTINSANNGSLTITNATISANAVGGNNNGGQITLNAGTGNLTLSSTALSANGFGTANGGSITITGGTTSIASGSISANAGATSGNGGQVSLSSTSLTVTGGTLALNANANGTGNGGTISASATGATANLTIGTASGNLLIAAAGGSTSSTAGNGGTVSLTAGQDISLNPSGSNLNIGPRGNNGSGAILALTAGRNLSVTTNLSVNGVGTGSGGSVAISTNSSTVFTTGASTTNGINGNITANAGATYGSSGGSISITNNGTGGITITAFTNLSAAGATGGGSAGSISVKALSTGALTLPSGTWSLNAAAGTSPSPGTGSGNFNGGQLYLEGNTLSTPGALTLNANAVAAGNGGTVSIKTNSATSNITIGGAGNIVISAQGGSAGSSMGNGGQVTITAGQDLTINTASSNLLTAPLGNHGHGAQLSLNAGRNLFATGSALSANASQVAGSVGNGGMITLTSSSSSVFNIASGATTNGINAAAPSVTANGGASRGSGGSITIRNKGTGGITLSAGNSLTVTPVNGAGGSITLDTSNGLGGAATGNITLPGSATINVNAVSSSTSYAGGTLTIKGSTITTSSANAVTLQSNGVNFGNGGTISITASAGNLNINSTAVTGNIAISATSGTSGGAGGTVTLSASGNITVTTPNSNLNTAPAVNGNGGNISLSGTNVVVNTSGFTTSTQGIGFGSGGNVSITTNSSTAFNIGTAGTNGIAGGINVSAGSTFGNAGTITIINTGGGITVGAAANITANTSSGGGLGGTITLTANGALSIPTGTYAVNSVGNFNGGQINLSGTSLTISGGTLLTLRANGNGTGNGGTISLNSGSTAMTVGTSNINLSVNGGTNLSDSGDAGTLTLISTGNLTINTLGLSAVPLGTNGRGGIFNFTGANVAITNALSAAGSGTGSGGQITITSNSSSAFNIGGGTGASGTNGSNAAITANAGNGTLASGVNGGTISITNNGTAGITLPSAANISVNPSGKGGAGGTLQFTATQASAVLSLPNGTFSANAVGTGNFNAGKLIINVGQVTVAAGAPLLLAANATGNGAGGTISVTTTNSTAAGALTVGSASQNLQISAFGGAIGLDAFGSPIANGKITLSSANALTVNLSNINAAGPDSINGNGASMTLAAGTAAPANLQVTNGSIIADATGNGIAGNVSITYNSSSPFVIGGTVTNSGISGNISANTAGTGKAGNITITNLNASALNITLTGTISANSALGTPGIITFTPQAGQAVNSVSGAGSLTGTVNASGTAVTINPQTSGAALTIGTITSTAGNINITNNIGSAALFMSTTGLISAAGTGALVSANGGSVTFYGSVNAAGSVTIASATTSSVNNVTATNGAVNITSVGNLQIIPGATINATNGNILVRNTSTSAGLINVAQFTTMTANEGNVTIENDNVASGSITLNPNTTLSASTTGYDLGNVYIVIGSPPAVPVTGSTPANTTVNATNGGIVYFGTNSISASSPTNNVNANGGLVIFNTGSLASSAISLGGSVTVNATTASQLLTSLDLTDPAVTSRVLSLQTSLRIGGALTVTSGVATGGNAIITPYILAPSLSGQNVPNNVTLTMQGFTPSNPININITGASFTNKVIISGTTQFINSGASNPVINVTSNQPAPAVLINGTGTLTSDGSLSLSSNGNMSLNGAITTSASGTLTLSTSNNAAIALGANIGTAGATTNIQVNGTGTLSQTAGRILGATVNLTSGSGNIFGTSDSPSTPILTTATTTLTVNTTSPGSGSAYVSNNAAVAIGTSLVGNSLQISTTGTNSHLTTSGTITATAGLLQLSANGNITTSNVLSGNTLGLQTTSGSGNITLNANASGTNGVTSSCCTGIFTVGNGATLSSTNAPISITTSDITLTGNVNAGTSTVSLIPCSNSQPILVGGSSPVGGSLNLTAGNLSHITAGTLIAGSATSAGGISIVNPVTLPGSGTPGTTPGLYNISFQNGGAGGSYSGGSTINMQGQNLTVNVAGTLNTGASAISGTTDTISLTGGSVTVGTGGINLSGAGTVNIVSTNGNISTTGAISAPASAVSLSANGNITTSNTITSNTLNLQTTSGSGTITISANASGTNGVTASCCSALFTVSPGVTLSSTNAPISITATDIAFNGSVSAGTGTVSLLPCSDSQAVLVGGVSTVGGSFNATAANLSSITAGTVIVATNSSSGGLTLASSYAMPTSGTAGTSAGLFNLDLRNGALSGSYSGNGNTINTQGQTLTINVGGALNTGAAAMSSNGGIINLTGGAVTIGTGGMNLAGAATVNIANTAASTTNIVFAGTINAGSAGSVNVVSNNSSNITSSTGVTAVADGSIVLRTLGSGSVGSVGTPFATTAQNVTANSANGSVYINDTRAGNVNLRTAVVGGTQNAASGTFSLTTAQDLTTINAFASINNLALTSTAGSIDLSGIVSAGNANSAGGSLAISAGNNIIAPGNISPATLSSNGANGTNGTSSGGIGSNGGSITLMAGLASTSGSITLPNMSLQANGGNGGTASSAAGIAGNGGAGGTVSVLANGTVTTATTSTNGGNGGNNTSAAGGTGGTGGAGGTSMIISTNNSLTSGTVTALGGNGGNGSSGAIGTGGAGGAGGKIDIESQSTTITITGNVNASGGTGGTGTAGGAAGQPTGTNGHSIQILGIGAVSVSGYIAAAAGGSAINTITATNADILILSKSLNLPATGAALFGGVGGYNAFGGSSMTIVAPGTATLTQYSTNLDLTTTSTVAMTAFTGGTFTVGTGPPLGGNGAAAQLGTRLGATLSINGINAANPVNGGSILNTFSGNLVVIYNGNSFLTVAPSQNITPAQWVAAVQVATTSVQDVLLNPGGTGTQVSGVFTLSDSNYPLITAGGGTSNNFTTINIPTQVVQNVTTTNTVTSTGNVTIDGVLNFQSGSSGALTASGNNLTVTTNGTLSAAAGNLTLTATGTNSAVSVGVSGSISAAAGNVLIQTFNVNNSGLITSSANGGSVTIQNGNTLTLSGNGSVTTTGTGANSILIQTTTNNDPINMNGSWTFNPGASGTVNFTATTTNSPITIAAAQTQTISQGSLIISARTLALGTGALLTHLGTTGTAITINNGGVGAALVIEGPSGGAGTISTSGANINLTTANTQAITFDKSSAGAATINLNTQGLGVININSGANQNINALVTVASDSSIQSNFTGSRTFNLNGTLTSTKAAGTIALEATADLTIAGTGQITFSSGASGAMTLTANGANTVALNGTTTFDPGTGGSLALRAQASGGIVQIAAGVTQTVASGAAVNISAPNFRLLGDGAVLNATGASDITIDSGTTGNNLTVRTQGLSTTSAINTTGGTILFAPTDTGALTFSRTNTGPATLNLNTGGTGLIRTVASANTAVNATVTLSTDSNVEMNINGGNTATITGTITTSKISANLLIQSSTALTLAGTGTLEVTGGGAGYITVQAQGANALTLAGSLNYNADANTFVQLQSTGLGGSVIVNNNNTQTLTGSPYLQVIAPQITFNGTATVNNSDGYMDLTGNTLNTSILLNNGSTVTLNLGTGVAFLGSYTTQALVIDKTTGAGTSTLQINSEVQTFSYGADQTINSGVILSSNNNITMNVDGGTLTNSGTITSSAAAGAITLSSRNANLTLAGGPTSTVSITGGGGAILVSAEGIGQTLTLNSSTNFDPGTTGTVTFIGDSFITGNTGVNATVSNGSLAIYGQNVTFGTGATITGSSTVSFNGYGGGNPLTITTQDNSSATITATSGQIEFHGSSVTFAKSSGSNSTTLNLNNAPVYIQSVNGDMTIANNFTLNSDGDITLSVNGGATLFNNGIIQTTKNAGNIYISSNVGLTLGGTSTSTFKVTGTGANSISIFANGSGLLVNNSLSFDAGSSGTAIIAANSGTMSLAANKNITFANQTTGSVQATTLLLSGNNTITGSKTSGTALNIFSANPDPFTLNLQAATASTFATAGGAIQIFSPKNVTIGINGGSPTDTATLNLTGGPTTITSNQGTTVISNRVIINASSDITFNVNTITIGSNGQINTSLGSISLIARQGTISIGNNVTMYANEGNLVIQNTDTTGGAIDIASGANLTGFTTGNPALGFVNIVIGPIPSLPTVGSVPANVVVNESGGGVVYFGSNSINAAAPNNTINAKGRDVVFSTGGQSSSAITLGGNVTITADPPEASATAGSTITVGNLTDSQTPFNFNNALPSTDTTIANRVNSISSSVIPFDVSPASTALFQVSSDTINNTVMQALDPIIAEPEKALPNPNQEDEQYGSNDANKHPYQPISYSTGVQQNHRLTPSAGGESLHTVETTNATIKCVGKAKIAVHSESLITLNQGEALIATNKGPITVVAGDVRITIQPNTIATIIREENNVKVRNLYEPGNNSLIADVKDQVIKLGIGHELTVSTNEENLKSAMHLDNVGRRKIKTTQTTNNHHVGSCEFSLISSMQTSKVLSQLAHSAEADDKAITEKLIKMAACLMVTTASHGPYTGGQR